jgi:UDP-N-acetylglucosamine 1-carboxyvinyltransferase
MNDTLVVTKKKLQGKVKLSGAKNSGLKLLTASILTNGTVEIFNSPNGLLDMKVHIGMLEKMGKTCFIDKNYLRIEEPNKIDTNLLWDERSIRNSLLMLGCLTTRFGGGKVPLPGGCKLGERKYDIHVDVLEKLGARVYEEDGYLCTEVKNYPLKGVDIHLPVRSTGATENAIMTSSLAVGKTTIWNPHIRPEIIDLINMLNKMGAKIEVFGQKCIVVEGVKKLYGVKHECIPDNMEALTWAIGAVITGGDVEIINFPFHHLEVPLAYLKESGMKYYRGENSIIVRGGTPYPIEISTGPYPGINSDMQPLFAIYGAVSKGTSKIVDLRFPGRYAYAEEMAKMGVDFEVKGDMLVINGGNKLKGTVVNASDLRAGISLLLAGLVAEGTTTIENAWQIERGYENIHQKLKDLTS